MKIEIKPITEKTGLYINGQLFRTIEGCYTNRIVTISIGDIEVSMLCLGGDNDE